MKKVEWTLFKFDLERLEQTADWEQIDKLRGKWLGLYDDWFKNGGNVPDFAQLMEKMKETLEKIGINCSALGTKTIKQLKNLCRSAFKPVFELVQWYPFGQHF
ncbi:hypothetical protein GPALN_006052 [Globodera pallida]|nr:hypothetical protein GPALN_006052 [Globodera pallida]